MRHADAENPEEPPSLRKRARSQQSASAKETVHRGSLAPGLKKAAVSHFDQRSLCLHLLEDAGYGEEPSFGVVKEKVEKLDKFRQEHRRFDALINFVSRSSCFLEVCMFVALAFYLDIDSSLGRTVLGFALSPWFSCGILFASSLWRRQIRFHRVVVKLVILILYPALILPTCAILDVTIFALYPLMGWNLWETKYLDHYWRWRLFSQAIFGSIGQLFCLSFTPAVPSRDLTNLTGMCMFFALINVLRVLIVLYWNASSANVSFFDYVWEYHIKSPFQSVPFWFSIVENKVFEIHFGPLEKFTEYEARCLANAFQKNVSFARVDFGGVKLGAKLGTILMRPLLGHPMLHALKFNNCSIFEEEAGPSQSASEPSQVMKRGQTPTPQGPGVQLEQKDPETAPVAPTTAKAEEESKSSDEGSTSGDKGHPFCQTTIGAILCFPCIFCKPCCARLKPCCSSGCQRCMANPCFAAFNKYFPLLTEREKEATNNLGILTLLCRMLTEGDLRILDLSGNQLGEKDVLVALGHAISESKCSDVRLDDNALADHSRIGDFMERIAKGRARISYLSLAKNKLGSNKSHISLVKRLLKKNSLHRLNLSYNEFGDSAALTLSKLFCDRRIPINKDSTGKLVLDLRHNAISAQGQKRIEEVSKRARNPLLKIRLFGNVEAIPEEMPAIVGSDPLTGALQRHSPKTSYRRRRSRPRNLSAPHRPTPYQHHTLPGDSHGDRTPPFGPRHSGDSCPSATGSEHDSIPPTPPLLPYGSTPGYRPRTHSWTPLAEGEETTDDLDRGVEMGHFV